MTELHAASEINSGRTKIISGINAPLGFFVLALLVVEVFLGSAGIFFPGLPASDRIHLVYIGVALFLVIVGIVALLVIRYPKNLVFTEISHLRLAALYGVKENPLSEQAAMTALPVASPLTQSVERAQLLATEHSNG